MWQGKEILPLKNCVNNLWRDNRSDRSSRGLWHLYLYDSVTVNPNVFHILSIQKDNPWVLFMQLALFRICKSLENQDDFGQSKFMIIHFSGIGWNPRLNI